MPMPVEIRRVSAIRTGGMRFNLTLARFHTFGSQSLTRGDGRGMEPEDTLSIL